MRYHLLQKFFEKVVKIKETSHLNCTPLYSYFQCISSANRVIYVNDSGPDANYEGMGKGFGGGGYYDMNGLPGVVLLEVKPK